MEAAAGEAATPGRELAFRVMHAMGMGDRL